MSTYSNSAAQQHSLRWYRDRLGRITGSAVGDIFGKGRSKEDVFSKTALSYLASVAAERMIPDCIVADDDTFALYLDEVNVSSKAMRIGSEREAEARDLYRDITSCFIEETGCIQHPAIAGFASSPDGLVLDDARNGAVQGTIEIKCPKPATYLDYLSNVHSPDRLKALNANYYWQCMSHIAVTGALWCDFILYCPYNATPIHVVRIPRDPAAINELQSRVALALREVENIIARASAPG